MSTFWRSHTLASSGIRNIGLTIPAFSFTGVEWLEASYTLIEYAFELTSRIALMRTEMPLDANFVLGIRLSDGTRYLLWEHPDMVLHYPLYNGETLDENFTIEVWTVDSTSCSSAALTISTADTESTLSCPCGTPTATNRTSTTVTDIFALLDTDSGDTDIILTFDQPYGN